MRVYEDYGYEQTLRSNESGGRSSMTPEAKVKREVTNKLKEKGAYYFFPMTGRWT